MSAQHTPGPWVAERLDDEGHYDITNVSKSAVIATTAGWYDDDDDRGTTEAAFNARLIAAAPEMLEALKDAQAAMAWWDNPEQCTEDFKRVSLARARAAIAKAEGRAE